jgi:tetratricopeptide (TPR) repeat protein
MIDELIKNLTPGEKRYLALNLSVYKNEAGKLKYFKQLATGTIDVDTIPSLIKNNLQSKILKLLAEYSGQNKSDFEIISLIYQAEYLSKKKFYHQADKLFQKALKNAVYTENYALYFFALKKMENNLLKLQDIYKIQQHIAQTSYTLRDISGRLFNLANYSLITCKAMYLSRKNHNPKTKIQQKEFVNFLNNELLSSKNFIKDFYTAFKFYNSHALINYELGNITETLKYLKKQERLILKKPHLLNDYIEEYVSVVYNLAVITMSQKKFVQAEKYINKLDDMTIKDTDLITQTQSNILMLKLNCYYESGQYNKILLIEKQLNEHAKKYNSPILLLLSNYILSLVYLSKNNYKISREYLNRILNDKNDNYREDIFCFARIINVVIQFEKNDTDTLPYSIISTKNYLKKKKRFHPLEKIFLNYMGKILKRPERKVEYLKLMQEEMKQKINKNELLRKTLEYFDFIGWVNKLCYKHYSSL